MKRTVMGCTLAVVALALAVGRPAEARTCSRKSRRRNRQLRRTSRRCARTRGREDRDQPQGEVKNTKIESCRYGSDGKVLKTPMSEPPAPQKKQRGMKGRVIEKKTGEMKEDMQAAVALVQQYVPPSPDKIQAAMAAGKITMAPGAATSALRIADYEKAGDALVLTLARPTRG